jgi:hypothetical protein
MRPPGSCYESTAEREPLQQVEQRKLQHRVSEFCDDTADQYCADGKQLMCADFTVKADCDRNQHLFPIPRYRATMLLFLHQVGDKAVVHPAGSEVS